MGRLLGRLTSVIFSLFLAVFSVNLSGVMTIASAYAHDGNGGDAPQSQTMTVTPEAPTENDVCGTVNDSYTVPMTTGVDYFVNNKVAIAGTYVASGSVHITASAQHGYVLSRNAMTSWNLLFTNSACAVPVTPTAPTNTDLCGTKDDNYTIPTTAHVTYKKLVGYFFLLPIYQTIPAGTYNGSKSVVIVAVADNGYTVAGKSYWILNFSDAPCVMPVAAVAPTFNDVCGTANDSYTIPYTKGIDYTVNGHIVTAGTYPATGAVTITAVAENGYTLADAATNSWSQDFSDTQCAVPHLTASAVCGDDGVVITLTNTGDIDTVATIAGLPLYDVAADSTMQVVLPFTPLTHSASAHVTSGALDLFDQDFNCDPGQDTTGATTGNGGSTGNGSMSGNGGAGSTSGSTGTTTSPSTPGKGATIAPMTVAVVSTKTAPTDPSVTSLPDTGSNPLIQAFTLFIAGISAYALMYFILMRRELNLEK